MNTFPPLWVIGVAVAVALIILLADGGICKLLRHPMRPYRRFEEMPCRDGKWRKYRGCWWGRVWTPQ